MLDQTIIRTLHSHMRDERYQRLHDAAIHRMRGLTVVLESLYDPGNQGAVFRSADAHGLTDVHVIKPENATKLHARSVSRGAEKWLNVHTYDQPDVCLQRLREQGFQIAVADLRAASPLRGLNFSKPTAVVFGSERFGVSDYMREQADVRFRIPMHGFVQSLNISVAAAITLNVARQGRERALGAMTDLSPTERQHLLARWMRRSVTESEQILKDAGVNAPPMSDERPWEERLAEFQANYQDDTPAIGIERSQMRGRAPEGDSEYSGI